MIQRQNSRKEKFIGRFNEIIFLDKGINESHYAKRWTDKDTDDLVEVISFLCKAIEQDEERKQLVAEMPEQKKK